jgi:divalent metal cation (Fe/Co/Zn/Cd) transporter
LLTVVAWTLAKITHKLLIGFSASPEDQAKALAVTESTPNVVRVTQLLTVHLGPDVVLLAIKVAFAPELDAKGIEDVTNEIERRLRLAVPQMKKIFIEVDARGDMRGVEAARAMLESKKELIAEADSAIEKADAEKGP